MDVRSIFWRRSAKRLQQRVRNKAICSAVSVVERKGIADGPNGSSAQSAAPQVSTVKDQALWSARVTRESDALDLERGVFSLSDPKRIAASLKRSSERSRQRKSDPYRSALSMLTFYVNRAGKNLPASRRRTLDRAKSELRRQFGRD
jgi:hypothetical protein